MVSNSVIIISVCAFVKMQLYTCDLYTSSLVNYSSIKSKSAEIKN